MDRRGIRAAHFSSTVQLRMEEKRIVSGTMDAVRARLAPIRGIPTKQGNLQDPNSVSLADKAQFVLLPSCCGTWLSMF